MPKDYTKCLVSVYYLDGSSRVHLGEFSTNPDFRRINKPLECPREVKEWIIRSLKIGSPWGRYSHSGIRYEYETGNYCSLRARLALGFPPLATPSEEEFQRAYLTVRERLDTERATRLGPEFLDLCNIMLEELEISATALAKQWGYAKIKEVKEMPFRYNPDLDDAFGF